MRPLSKEQSVDATRYLTNTSRRRSASLVTYASVPEWLQRSSGPFLAADRSGAETTPLRFDDVSRKTDPESRVNISNLADVNNSVYGVENEGS